MNETPFVSFVLEDRSLKTWTSTTKTYLQGWKALEKKKCNLGELTLHSSCTGMLGSSQTLVVVTNNFYHHHAFKTSIKIIQVDSSGKTHLKHTAGTITGSFTFVTTWVLFSEFSPCSLSVRMTSYSATSNRKTNRSNQVIKQVGNSLVRLSKPLYLEVKTESERT